MRPRVRGSSPSPSSGARPPSPSAGGPTPPRRGGSSGGGLGKGLWIALAVLALVIVAAVLVFAWYIPSRSADVASSTTVVSDPGATDTTTPDALDPETADLQAQSLLRAAMSALEDAYLDLQTFSPEHLTPDMLSAIEASVTFVPWPDATAFSASTALAANKAVAYAGDATNYSLGTVSVSGNVFGVIVSKEGEGNIEYYVNGKEQDWDDLATPSTTTPTTATPATGPAGGTGESVLYQDYELGCSFSYPLAWSGHSLTQLGVQPLGGDQPRLAVGDPSDPIAQSSGTPSDFIVFFGTAPGAGSTSARSVIESIAAGIGTTYPGMTVTTYEEITDFQVNGLPACSWAFRAQRGGGMPTAIWKYVAIYFNGDAFVFCFGSDESQWQTNRAVFESTLGSFQMTLMPPPLAP